MIYLTGDTHGNVVSRLKNDPWNLPSQMTEDDMIIILGDCGLIWNLISTRYEREEIKWLDSRKYHIAFIDGNHENFDRLATYETEQWCSGKIQRISDNIIHLMRGEIYRIPSDDQTFDIFTFGGAYSIDKHLRTPGWDWWPQEVPTMREYEYGLDNLSKHDCKVDYILTHDCPSSIVKTISALYSIDGMEKYLQIVGDKTTYKKWYFGHHHLNKTFGENGKYTCLYENIIPLGS